MGQLFFKGPLQQAIREGRKRTTLRRWDRERMSAGQRVYSLGLGWLCIEGVEEIELTSLDDQDARADGFASMQDLHAALRALYPEQENDGKRWWKVTFHREEAVKKTSRGKKTKQTTKRKVRSA